MSTTTGLPIAAAPAAQDPLVVALDDLAALDLPLAGGKAANLGELLRTGLPAPRGFCVTTIAYDRTVARADLEQLLGELVSVAASDHHRLGEIAAEIRRRLLGAPIPDDVAEAVRVAVEQSGAEAPLAVRSSATAEDLPFASFAGQQETYLNVTGTGAVLDAVRRCWASLWSDRAVVYRAANGIDSRGVRLAVIVQRLVDAAIAGVLFTANPLTGRRAETVIDASPGLGEAVVAGAVNPDHFVVDGRSGAILERRLGDKQVQVLPAPGGGTRRVTVASSADASCLSDRQLQALVALGSRVEEHFGAPQDVEFALDAAGVIWLTQSRPITTLFPLPANAPLDDQDLRVYFNVNVMQGVFGPITPLGLEAFCLLGLSVASLFRATPPHPTGEAPVLAVAAGRVFLDLTALVRSKPGRRVLATVLSQVEARSEPLLRTLFGDPRLAPRQVAWRELLTPALRALLATRLPVRVAAALIAPAAARATAWRLREQVAGAGAAPPAGASERVDRAERLLLDWPARIVPGMAPLLIAGLGSLALAERLLGDLATPEERDVLRRALPHNPTTEMDLALWELAVQVRLDPASAFALRTRTASELAVAFHTGTLPGVLRGGLASFLDGYGHRAVAEIDLGLPRWSEDPTHLLQTLANYLMLPESARTPAAQFREAASLAEGARRRMERRAAELGRLRGFAVSFLLRRGRALAGMREVPKFLMVLLFAEARALLKPVGVTLTDAGRLAAPDDLFFLSFADIRAAIAGADLRAVASERRATYMTEQRRRHVPRLLLSDGAEPSAETLVRESSKDTLWGVPASAGQVRGRARVILEPLAARLAPGEILVAPSTDPGWTPLFLTAGGLVMEMGGAMSHGAVVAREYGIPAVVGVPGATERIADGQEIVVDGAAGTVFLGRSVAQSDQTRTGGASNGHSAV